MEMTSSKSRSLFKALIFLAIVLVVIQIILLTVNAMTTQFFDTAFSTSLTFQILSSKIFITGILFFIISQTLLYGIYVTLIWYLAVSVGELLRLQWRQVYLLGIIFFLISTVFVFAANNYLVPHSFFADVVKNILFNGNLSTTTLKSILVITGGILIIASMLTLINLIRSIYHREHALRQATVLLFFTGLIIFIGNTHEQATTVTNTMATADKPNIIIIGIDAVRPDFIGFYNHEIATPTIDELLRTSTNFAAAYTALPRTFPSWTGILTGTYPKNNNARGNNTDFTNLAIDETMPKIFQAAGYETIYSTDDTRFNNTNEIFGFDRVITPPMGLNDFVIGTLNDFPLSNLIIPTAVGKLLFPYNYANHGASITYAPNNYLQMLNTALKQRSSKPLLLAVHFTITHWPFYWFNDRTVVECSEVCRYQAGIQQADHQLEKFLQTLAASHLLDHAIVVLLSDHGTSLGLRGDRITSANNYLGDAINIKKLPVYQYANTFKYSSDIHHDFGVDTSYGYGGDVLSLSQYHSLLAFKGYGVDIGKPQTITDRVMLMDIAPTLLKLAHLSPLAHADGISLTPYLSGQPDLNNSARPLFFESSFTLEEIEKSGISLNKVLAKTIQLYRMDKHGLIFIKPNAEQAMVTNKQFAILQGDWMLAYYPAAEHLDSHFDPSNKLIFKKNIIPPFMVLANVKTGKWTTELTTPFAQNAPTDQLMQQLHNFYGQVVAIN
jgi:hypothetical protein